MNCISIDLEKLEALIKTYINTKEYIIHDPIMLMNEDTRILLKNQNQILLPFMPDKQKNIFTFWGYKIAIANWLPLGEIEII